MKNPKLYIAFATACLFSFSSCEKEDGDTTPAVAFASVNAILTTNCQPCHTANSGAQHDSRAKFVNDFGVAKNVASKILSRVSKNPGEAGFMPNNGIKLSAGNIQTIQDWIDGGLKEN